MARRSPTRKVSYFELVAWRLARNTVIESTFEVGRQWAGFIAEEAFISRARSPPTAADLKGHRKGLGCLPIEGHLEAVMRRIWLSAAVISGCGIAALAEM